MEKFITGHLFDTYLSTVGRKASEEVSNREKPAAGALLERLAYFLTAGELLEIEDGDLARIRSYLTEGLVYVVFNHTPLAIQGTARDFVTVMFHDKVNIKLLKRAMAKSWGREDVAPPRLAPHVDVIRGPGSDRNMLMKAWKEGWSRYQHITKKLDRRKIATFNEYLLRRSYKPLTVGVYWGEGGETIQEVNDCYIPIPAEVNSRTGKIIATDEVPRVVKRWGKMIPTDPRYLEGSGTAINELLKYYACYGGNAFLSIPFTFGREAPDNTAVLSICSDEVLSVQRMRDWRLIADRVFIPLLVDEWEHHDSKARVQMDNAEPRFDDFYSIAAEEAARVMSHKMAHHSGSTDIANEAKLLSVAMLYVQKKYQEWQIWKSNFEVAEWDPIEKCFLDANEGKFATLKVYLNKVLSYLKDHEDEGLVDYSESLASAMARKIFGQDLSETQAIHEMEIYIEWLFQMKVARPESLQIRILKNKLIHKPGLPQTVKIKRETGEIQTVVKPSEYYVKEIGACYGTPKNGSATIKRIVESVFPNCKDPGLWMANLHKGNAEKWIKELCRRYAKDNLKWTEKHTWPIAFKEPGA